MNPDTPFEQLIAQVRLGDDAAAAELLRRYEPAVRRAVRIQLRDPRLRRFLDSMDICQSVMASFFLRAFSGQYDLADPDRLQKLLIVMARNKLASQARKMQVARRDAASFQGDRLGVQTLAAPDASPSRQVAGRELLELFRNQLTERERQIVDLRGEGKEWADVAALLGGTPEALRKTLSRALDRVAQQLGLEELVLA